MQGEAGSEGLAHRRTQKDTKPRKGRTDRFREAMEPMMEGNFEVMFSAIVESRMYILIIGRRTNTLCVQSSSR
jgi:hypothetical protein